MSPAELEGTRPPASRDDDARLHRELPALSEAILAIAAEQDLTGVLQMIVDRARELLGARYAAIGVPDAERKTFQHFLVSGMSEEEIAALPHPPRGRGLLAVNLLEGSSLRVADVPSHPRSEGVPPGHPPVHSFLGVPIRQGDEVLGNLYLTNKLGAEAFSAEDEARAALLARHAAMAIVNVRLHRRLRDSERRYRLLAEEAPEILFSLDAEGVLTYVNDRSRQIVGMEPASLVGRRLRDVVLPEDASLVDSHVGASRGGSQARFRLRARDAEGAVRVFDVSLIAGREREAGFTGIARDVTERHRIARGVRERSAASAEDEEPQDIVALIIQAQEDERARIAGDLHDTTVQTLIAIGRRLRSLAAGACADPAVRRDLEELSAAALAEAEEVRRLSRDLRPSTLDHLGLAAALEGLAEGLRRRGVAVRVQVRGDEALLGERARTGLFRIAQEAMTNVRRHAEASRVWVGLWVGEEVRLSIRDDGRGFAAEQDAMLRSPWPDRLGLAGMRERAAMLGGRLETISREGGGTEILAVVPAARDQARRTSSTSRAE